MLDRAHKEDTKNKDNQQNNGQCTSRIKKKGRPRTRLKEEVKRDLKIVQVPEWKTKAKNRRLWNKIVKLSKGLLRSQY